MCATYVYTVYKSGRRAHGLSSMYTVCINVVLYTVYNRCMYTYEIYVVQCALATRTFMKVILYTVYNVAHRIALLI
jgi:hypothetical protein